MGIWRIDEVIENITKVMDDGDDIEFLLKQLHYIAAEADVENDERIPDELKLRRRAWMDIEKIRIKDVQIQVEL